MSGGVGRQAGCCCQEVPRGGGGGAGRLAVARKYVGGGGAGRQAVARKYLGGGGRGRQGRHVCVCVCVCVCRRLLGWKCAGQLNRLTDELTNRPRSTDKDLLCTRNIEG